MKRDLRFEVVYPYPPERVWRALTDRDELTQWLMENDFDAKPGHKFQFHGQVRPGFDGTVHCEVIELEYQRQIAYRWVNGSLDSVVRFQIELADNGGTRLILEHCGFDGAGGNMISALIAWNRMLREKLPLVIGGIPFSTVQCNIDIAKALIERYERGTQDLEAVIGRATKELVDVIPGNEQWSVHQTALHIVDAEIVGAMRLRMLAAQPGSILAAYNGEIWARELQYHRQSLEPALELFQALRRTTAEMLREIPASAWSNRGEHEEAGEVSLESLLDSHCEHSEAHLEEIVTLIKKLSIAPEHNCAMAE